jgi:hypothetical protein
VTGKIVNERNAIATSGTETFAAVEIGTTTSAIEIKDIVEMIAIVGTVTMIAMAVMVDTEITVDTGTMVITDATAGTGMAAPRLLWARVTRLGSVPARAMLNAARAITRSDHTIIEIHLTEDIPNKLSERDSCAVTQRATNAMADTIVVDVITDNGFPGS